MQRERRRSERFVADERGDRDGAEQARPGFFRATAPALLFAFFAICALAAAIFAGLAEAIAIVVLGVIVAGGASMWGASARRKAARDARAPGAADRDDAVPGIGADRARPVGDTPEAHDEITARDLPKAHPGRRAAERQAEELGG